MMKRLLLAAALGLSACAGPQGPSTVTATDAWCRPTPNGARAGACYPVSYTHLTLPTILLV